MSPKHADRVPVAVRYSQIGKAVAVEVSHGDAGWESGCRVIHVSQKAPQRASFPVAEQYTYRVALLVGDNQVQRSVSGEVGCSNRNRSVSRSELVLSLEGAVAFSQKHAYDVVVIVVGDRQIQEAVTIEVHRHYRVRVEAGVVGYSGVERAIALSQKNADCSVHGIGDHQV